MTTAIITGGRDYTDRDRVWTTLDTYRSYITLVVQGGARGADKLAADWAAARGVPCETFVADWAAHGKAAGPLRNRQMLEAHPDAVVVAFPGGRGTANCVSEARRRGMRLLLVEPQ